MESELEKTFVAYGLIHRTEGSNSHYLVHRPEGESLWTPIRGIRLEKESFRDTVIREIGWILELDRDKDFVVSNMSASAQEYVEEVETGRHHFAVAFYRARLFTKRAREKVDNDPNARWISARELCEGVFEDQEGIDPTVVAWINQWSVLNPWE